MPPAPSSAEQQNEVDVVDPIAQRAALLSQTYALQGAQNAQHIPIFITAHPVLHADYIVEQGGYMLNGVGWTDTTPSTGAIELSVGAGYDTINDKNAGVYADIPYELCALETGVGSFSTATTPSTAAIELFGNEGAVEDQFWHIGLPPALADALEGGKHRHPPAANELASAAHEEANPSLTPFDREVRMGMGAAESMAADDERAHAWFRRLVCQGRLKIESWTDFYTDSRRVWSSLPILRKQVVWNDLLAVEECARARKKFIDSRAWTSHNGYSREVYNKAAAEWATNSSLRHATILELRLSEILTADYP
ncbi:hypothetical protein MKEN_00315600 [Mycena kentingensis (nom. inval.)]|nr:hypothetical protein MKEN_00315600 [Mycena kentingensis (nom. inval.)]